LAPHGTGLGPERDGLGRNGDARSGPLLPDPGRGGSAGGGLVEALLAAIAGLPLFEREVYLLAAREGLDDRAIGQRLGIGGGEVQHHLAVALVRIASALDGEIAD
jgi:DNA-directed RNA polymerase specialized sigma24 family protein